MKETKVYTGRRNGKHAELMQRIDKALKEQHFAFVFTKQELKDHDRELVKEVCDDLALSLVEFSEDFEMLKDEILQWLQEYKDQKQEEYEK